MIPDVPPPDPAADDGADPAADEAAALDDYLGGFAPDCESSGSASATPEEVADTLDLILRLRQTAAADGCDVRLPSPEAPQTIGRYELIAVAGQGGFAVVWEAIDRRLRRRVAVKLRHADTLLSPTLRRRFLREAEIASQLIHPHIVTIHEVGEENGREYIVEEFCAGGSLADWLSRHSEPLPPRDAARLVQMLADAAAYAHDRGVTHRDIKPANVLLTPAAQADDAVLPDHQTVKLADFGLGSLHDGGSDLTQLTASGSRLGTPAWMAPEQIDRSFGPVGPATDVHAIGLLLQRLLTGQSPHEGRTDVEIYRSVLLDEPVAADRLIKGIPRDLAAVCASCLAKRPTDRYPSAAAMAADLERFLDGRPTVARPLSPAARLGRLVARRRVAVGLLAGLLAAILGLTWSARAWLLEGRSAQVHREEIRQQTAAVELQRAFEAWRTGNVNRAKVHAAEVRHLSAAAADSLAGRWLEQRLHGERRLLYAPSRAGVPAAAHAVASHGGFVAAGFADGTLRVIGDDGRCTAEIPSAHDEINDLCFSPDGRLIATVGQDGRCRRWRLTDKGGLEHAGTVPGKAPLYGVTFLADGRHVVTGGEDRMVRACTIDATDHSHEIPVSLAHDEPADIEALALVSGGTVAVACGDHVFLVDVLGRGDLQELEHRRQHTKPPVFHSITVSADGKRVAVGSSGRNARVWSSEDRRLLAILPVQPAWVYGCSFSPDGDELATACRDGMVRVFDVVSGESLSTLRGHVGRVWDVTFDPGGRVLSAGEDGTVREWDTSRGPELDGTEPVAIESGDLGDVDILPNGPNGAQRLLACGPLQPPIMLSRANATEPWHRADLDWPISMDAPFNGLAADPAGDRFAVTFARRPNAVGTIASGGFGRVIALPAPGPLAGVAAWTREGRLVTVESEESVTLWSPDFGDRATLATLDWLVNDVAAAPSGPPMVAVVGQQIAIIPVPAGTERTSPTGRPRSTSPQPLRFPSPDTANCVAWSPDARRLVCGNRNGEATVYDAGSGKRLGALVPHGREVLAVAWSPDGQVLLTADEVSMRLSDARTLVVFDEVRPGWEIADLAVSPTGDLVAIAGCDASDRPLQTGRLMTLPLPIRPANE